MASHEQSLIHSLVDEYDALTNGLAFIDRSHLGRLKFSGDDALDLLNRLSTNHLTNLEVGQALPTVLTSNKGRVVDVVLVLRQIDHLLVFTSPETRQAVADYVDFYKFSEDVTVDDITDETAMYAVSGPATSRLTIIDSHGLGIHESVKVCHEGMEALIVRSDFLDLPGYDFIVDTQSQDSLRKFIQALGAIHVRSQAVETARIIRGIPSYGHEFSQDYNPLEAGLRNFISFSKGCYVGQEVVARLDTYKKVQRRLVSIQWLSDVPSTVGAALTANGEQVGVLTSAARLPTNLSLNVGLGYVKMTHQSKGAVGISVGGEILEGTIMEMPHKEQF